MIAYNHPNPAQHMRQTGERFAVVPSAPAYADQMVELVCAAYGVSPLETYRASQFRSQMRVFPEGQFLALDTAEERVVGLTVSMRVEFDPRYPLLESWVETTNYG